MVFVDLSEFRNTIKTKMPTVPLNIALNKISTILEIINGCEAFEWDLLDFDFVLTVHEGIWIWEIELWLIEPMAI